MFCGFFSPFQSWSTRNFSLTVKLALGVSPCLCLPCSARCCFVATPCVSYLPVATASCGLETLGFLTSFPFPDSFNVCTGFHFFISEYSSCWGEMYYSGCCSFPCFFSFLPWHRKRSSSLLLNPHLWTRVEKLSLSHSHFAQAVLCLLQMGEGKGEKRGMQREGVSRCTKNACNITDISYCIAALGAIRGPY